MYTGLSIHIKMQSIKAIKHYVAKHKYTQRYLLVYSAVYYTIVRSGPNFIPSVQCGPKIYPTLVTTYVH